MSKSKIDRDRTKIMIIGAGPTGLGAAWRLSDLGFANWILYERNPYPGGLSASFHDPRGFWWDVGGHIQFSHYRLFDRLMDQLLAGEWLFHQRNANIWIHQRFVPYPFQYNIHHLPPAMMRICVRGIETLPKKRSTHIVTFKDWIDASYGQGIAKYFMVPYNKKVWSSNLETMGYYWIGERVAPPDLQRIKRNIECKKDDVSWGPNNLFHFPKHGGTGEIWRRLSSRLPQNKIVYNKTIISIRAHKKQVIMDDGSTDSYDFLINTMPLNTFILSSDIKELRLPAQKLSYNSVNVIGLGIRGSPTPLMKGKCWMYFPERGYPFYRMTVFSNYSPYNVPDIKNNWSLMVEISEPSGKHSSMAMMVDRSIAAIIKAGFIGSRMDIVSIFTHREEFAYPIPTLDRDRILGIIMKGLSKLQIFSRGRFGLWKYEVGNQDHSMMQGIECIDRLLLLKKEVTAWEPDVINAKK